MYRNAGPREHQSGSCTGRYGVLRKDTFGSRQAPASVRNVPETSTYTDRSNR